MEKENAAWIRLEDMPYAYFQGERFRIYANGPLTSV